MKQLGDITKINGGEIEPFPIAVTKYHFPETYVTEMEG